MKILHIVQSLDPAWGGIARVLPALASELSRAGQENRIATLVGGRFGSAADVAGVEVLRFEAASGGGLARCREFNQRIEALIRECDVLHLHGLWTAQNWSAGRAARTLGRPYIMTPHSMMMPWAWRRSWWKKRTAGWMFEHRNLRGAACLHALADGEAAAIRALGFNDRITVIANGLHTSEYATSPSSAELLSRFPELKGRRWLVLLGRIHPQKGIVESVQAAFDTLAGDPAWHLVIAGPDEIGLRPVLEAAIERKGMKGRVTFTGLLGRAEVKTLLAGAGLLLQPSKSEGLSMSIVESLAVGTPVLISTECNMPEVQEEGAGRVVDPRRRPVAAALRELAALSEADRRAMSERARALARARYDWGVLIPKYVAMYEQTARKPDKRLQADG